MNSEAALKSFESVTFNSALALTCHKSLNQHGNRNRVDLIWVPDYSNIQGNEKVDLLAKLAATTEPIGPEPIIPAQLSQYEKSRYTNQKEKFISAWTSNCRQAKNYIRIDKNISKFLLNVSIPRNKR